MKFNGFGKVAACVAAVDGKRLVYRVLKNSKRCVVVADASGTVLRKHLAYEQVSETVFTADGKSVAYGVKDGRKLVWEVEKLNK